MSRMPRMPRIFAATCECDECECDECEYDKCVRRVQCEFSIKESILWLASVDIVRSNLRARARVCVCVYMYVCMLQLASARVDLLTYFKNNLRSKYVAKIRIQVKNAGFLVFNLK